jgi:uncharacterized RDD family membrane protein YckC
MENFKIKGKRLLAFVFDVFFIFLVSFSLYMLLGLIFKIDSEGYQKIMFFPLIILILLYIFFGEVIFKNTLGKYLLGIEVAEEGKQGDDSLKRFFRRGIMKILFPVEGIVLLFSKNNKRLGDLWAKTIVVNKKDNRLKPYTRLTAGILLIVALILIFRIASGIAVKKTDFYTAGLNYLKDNNIGEVTGFVKVVEQERNKVNFIVPVSNTNKDKYAIIYLDRNGNEWKVSKIDFSQEHIVGFSYGFSF